MSGGLMPTNITLEILRYRPEEEAAPVYQRYEVPFRKDWVILDALNYIKDEVDGSLAYRWSCRMGVCGSCGMMVNNRPRLTCSTFLREFYPKAVVVQPLDNFPIVRDLVVDMDSFMEKLRAVKPWIVREYEPAIEAGEELQTPGQVEQYKQLSM